MSQGLYQFTSSGGLMDKVGWGLWGWEGGKRSSVADMWSSRCLCSDTAVIWSHWRKVALRAVRMNEITQEDTGLWKKSSLLQHFRGGHWGRKTTRRTGPSGGKKKTQNCIPGKQRLCSKEDIKIMPDASGEDKYGKKHPWVIPAIHRLMLNSAIVVSVEWWGRS